MRFYDFVVDPEIRAYWRNAYNAGETKRILKQQRSGAKIFSKEVSIENFLDHMIHLNDQQLRNYVESSWEIILLMITKQPKNNYTIYNCFSCTRVVSAFTSFIMITPLIRYIGYIPIINHLIYTAILGVETVDEKKALMVLCNTVNRHITDKLSDIMGTSLETSNLVVLSRYKVDEYNIEERIKNVKSLNDSLFMLHLNSNQIMSVYDLLFSSLSDLFDGVMHEEIYGDELSHQRSDHYNVVTRAMLLLLDNQDDETIEGVLISYMINHYIFYYKHSIRYDLELLSIDNNSNIFRVYSKLIEQGLWFPPFI